MRGEQGKMSMSRTACIDETERIRIGLKFGGRRMLIHIALEDFARCVTGLSESPREVEEREARP